MAPIKHFAAPAGLTTPPLSFATRAGDLLFVSGIPGFDTDGTIPDGFEAQFGFVVRNIKRVLDEAGATLRDLVKVNVLLTRAADVGTMNALYASAFGPPPYPARSLNHRRSAERDAPGLVPHRRSWGKADLNQHAIR